MNDHSTQQRLGVSVESVLLDMTTNIETACYFVRLIAVT